MRLGAYPCKIKEGTVLAHSCQADRVQERHRHRYEFNNSFRPAFIQHGMVFCGLSPDEHLVEAMELSDAAFYLGVQYHPEFKSRPNKPHPLFRRFIAAASSYDAQSREKTAQN